MTKSATNPHPRFGMMNHPGRDLETEILAAAKLGFDFLDLTLEPPEASVEDFPVRKIRAALKKQNLGLVGHTGWHLQGNAAYREARAGVTRVLLDSLCIFHSLGAEVMTYHIHGSLAGYLGLQSGIDSQVETLKPVVREAENLGMTVLLEHVSGYPEQFEILDALFSELPSLGFHLDVGHANLTPDGTNATSQFLFRYGSRLRHIHFSDNRGRTDDHMPLGVGSVPWDDIVRELKAASYRGTITLEIFSTDSEYLSLSLARAREWFDIGVFNRSEPKC
ncbi:MAG: sugar phosphate isomerase/epimerase [Candidatus Hydrogenedentota bacterium]|nr:MAG: sugar phosphate isomerase/epimerase [Candidatus Hydrogenedentota bacterium]